MMKHKRGVNEFLDYLMKDIEDEYQQSIHNTGRKDQIFLDHFYTIRETMSYEETRESVLAFLAAGG